MNENLSRDYSRLDKFIVDRENDVGNMNWMFAAENEEMTRMMRRVTKEGIEMLHKDFGVGPGTRVLDIGCGAGISSDQFLALGCDVTGTTIKIDHHLQKAIDRGLRVAECDQSFMDFPPESFDLLYSRHVLEHSLMPYFTLQEYNRLLPKGGLCYVEVPHPDVYHDHESNHNHYAVFGMRMWESLFYHTGFKVLRALTMDIAGKKAGEETDSILDKWEIFILQKEYEGFKINWL